MAWQALIGPAISAGAGILGSLNKKGKSVAEQQMEAMNNLKLQNMEALSNYSKTGQLGQYQAGEPYTGDLGSFDPTQLENMGLEQLTQLMGSGMPETYTKGLNPLLDFMNTGYDAANSDLYKGFRTGAMREQQTGMDDLKRNLAVTGDLYSTNTGREAGLLGERTQQNLQNKLAELTDTNVARKLGIAKDVTQLGMQEEDLKQQRIQQAMTLGSLQRVLKDQEAKAKYAEFNRTRAEWQDTVDAAKQLASGGFVQPNESGSGNIFSELLNAGISGLTSAQGMSGWQSLFKGFGNNKTNTGSVYNGTDYSLKAPTLGSGSYLGGYGQ